MLHQNAGTEPRITHNPKNEPEWFCELCMIMYWFVARCLVDCGISPKQLRPVETLDVHSFPTMWPCGHMEYCLKQCQSVCLSAPVVKTTLIN